MNTKICHKCNIEKQLTLFPYRKETKNYRNECKECSNERKKQLIKMKFENYEWQNYPTEQKCITCSQVKEIDCFSKRKDTKLGIRRNCRDCKRIYNQNYYSENDKDLKEYQVKYRKENREKLNTYQKMKREIDSNFKLGCNLRCRTNAAFKSQNVRKTKKTFDLLGCSHSFFKIWIEYQLYGEMTMENYGKVWHIDHCLAISSFNLLDENEMRKCFNWLNLRPMYVKENISKGNKIDMWLYLLQQVKANYFIKINEQETR